MKKLLVLSHGRVTGENLVVELKKVFGRFTEIHAYSSEDGLPVDFKEHLLLVTTEAVLSGPLKRYLADSVQWIMAQRVINYQYLRPVIELPEGTEVLLVNDHEKTTHVAIEQLIGLGLNHVKYVPYYPGCRLRKAYAIAITPGEPHLVPASCKQVIDIATRQIDITTLIEIAEKLGILPQIKTTLSSQYVSDFVSLLRQLDSKAKEAERLQDSFMTLADHSGDGVVYTDSKGRIQLLNKAARRILGSLTVEGKNINGLVPDLKDLQEQDDHEIVSIASNEVFVSRRLVNEKDPASGWIYVFEDVSELRKLAYEVRRRTRKSEHVAYYHFKDIHHRSKVMEKTIDLAQKLARSESTILIEGESGTGKELLAQAIHNHSIRAHGPFVPVNFAALPYTLLESELFGYEEGAFTGAKKGGKPGLLEEAHGGTLFLDEIGDAPLAFQVRLLRVLQEKEIRRVGGRKRIPIDIRVIAATHRSLIQEVASGRFREDLFYRISVLPIKMPSLKERPEDILYLMDTYFKEFLNDTKVNTGLLMTSETQGYLKQYHWPGNIRQLMNAVEYLSQTYAKDRLIEIGDLPLYMRETERNDNQGLIPSLIGDELLWVLEQMDRYEHIGRRQLAELACHEGIELTEGKIRKLLSKGEEMGLIAQNQGRRGSSLTYKGKEAVKAVSNEQ